MSAPALSGEVRLNFRWRDAGVQGPDGDYAEIDLATGAVWLCDSDGNHVAFEPDQIAEVISKVQALEAFRIEALKNKEAA